MSYIDTHKLIYCMVTKKKPNSRELLAEVNRNKLEQALRKSKDGLPQPFVCTNKPIEEKNLAKMPYKDKQLLWVLYHKLKDSGHESEKVLQKLIKLRTKYPNVPAIYNYICLAYANTNQHEKYYQTIIDTYDKFPDYLFGKISAAEYCINNNRYKEVPDIFANKLEIYMHYPKTTMEFHVSEVRAFYSTVGRYYAKSKKIARAIYSYYITNQIDPEHWSTRKLADEIILAELEKLKNAMNRNTRDS